MRKKHFVKNRRKKKFVLLMIVLLAFMIGIGYSTLSTVLNIGGVLTVRKHEELTLYNVLKNAAQSGVYAKTYTGSHHDSFTEEPSKDIYYWNANNDESGSQVANMNNVIFANHCWQMIRTTDTGGVKLLYNGVVDNNQCLDTRAKSVGYNMRTTTSLSTTYYYGSSYSYDSTNGVFSLSGDITTGTIDRGKYTCSSTSNTATCSTLYLVDTLKSGSDYYVIPLKSNAGSYSRFGSLDYNRPFDSLAYVGYMYNDIFPVEEEYLLLRMNTQSSTVSHPEYEFYSDEIDYGNINANNYTLLNNPKRVSTLSDYSELVGKYVIITTSNSPVDPDALYVVGVNGNTVTSIWLNNGDLITSMMMGDTYTDNGNGTYTINNPTLVTYADWYNGTYSNYVNKYICDGKSATCSNLKHIAYTSRDRYYYWDTDHKYKYSNSVSYNGSTYTLTGDIKEIWDVPLTAEQQKLSTRHYTCKSNGTSCSEVYYLFHYDVPSMFYIHFSGEANISEVFSKMLNSDNINTNNSVIKTGIDAWYKMHLTDYTNMLEDTVYCNDRSTISIGGWDPNGGDITTDLRFKNYNNNTDLSCTNVTDKFSLSNTKAQLTYPVGLLSYPEALLLENNKIRGTSYWYSSPYNFNYTPAVRAIGFGEYYTFDWSTGVRPVISLKPGTKYASGDGTMANPYVVEPVLNLVDSGNGVIQSSILNLPGDVDNVEYSLDQENW